MGCMAEKNTIFIKIGRMGEKVKEMAYEDGITLGDAITKSGYSLRTDEIIELNGIANFGLSWRLYNSNVIILKNKPVQKLIAVKIGRVGQKLLNISVPEHSTVMQCLFKAFITTSADEELWLHENENKTPGYRVTMGTIVHSGYTIIIEERVDPRREAILKAIAEFIENETGMGCTWQELPFSYAEKILAIK